MSTSVSDAKTIIVDSTHGTQTVSDAKTSILDSTRGTQNEDDHAHTGSEGRHTFSSKLRPLQVKNSRNVTWAQPAARQSAGSTDGVDETLLTRPLPQQYNPLSVHSEKIVADKIEQLSQLDSPQLRELARRIGNMYKIETPRCSSSRFPSPYAHIVVGERWEQIQGCNRWAGMLDPIDPVLKAELLRYGEFSQATYDAFDGDTNSKYCGSSQYTKQDLLEKVGLDNRGYIITDFLYATADIDVGNFFSKGSAKDKWSKDSNWMGYVAVCTSQQEIERLGRRDIVVTWRGTQTKFEWIEDLQDYLAPAGFDPRGGNSNICVESGFLSVYKSSNASSRYNKTSAREQVLDAVKRLVEKYKHDRYKLSITVVGHSLGSALATLCGYDLAESKMNLLLGDSPVPKEWHSEKPQETLKERQSEAPGNKFLSDRIPITVFSYAGPRVGNQAFKDRVEAIGVAVLRVVNIHDLVPKVPGVLFQEQLEVLEKVITFLPSYKHVGQKIKVDNFLSPYIVETTDPANVHNLELYLHIVDGYQGTDQPFMSTLRDYALVNKGGDYLKKEYYIPPSWWQEAYKGLVRDKDGHWLLPSRDPELYPKTPTTTNTVQSQGKDRELHNFWHSVSIAVERAQKRLGAVPQVLPSAEQGQTAATTVSLAV